MRIFLERVNSDLMRKYNVSWEQAEINLLKQDSAKSEACPGPGLSGQQHLASNIWKASA